jgi:hypothetical protein
MRGYDNLTSPGDTSADKAVENSRYDALWECIPATRSQLRPAKFCFECNSAQISAWLVWKPVISPGLLGIVVVPRDVEISMDAVQDLDDAVAILDQAAPSQVHWMR